MPKILGELQDACVENRASDPASSTAGRIWRNTTEERVKTDDGTNKRALLRNDAKAVIGNNGTANNNIRFHRGAAETLQLTQGDDATAEGSMSTSLAKLSAKIESYLTGSLPAVGNIGRPSYSTDDDTIYVDTGAVWTKMISERFLAAKGDIITRNSSTMIGLTVGTDGQVLTANSGVAAGIEWATTASAHFLQTEEFTTSDDFEVPANIELVFVEMWGGGGGGGGGGAGSTAGGSGGTTTFNGLSAIGGNGGSPATGTGGAGGNGFSAWGAGGAGGNSNGQAGAAGVPNPSFAAGSGGAAGSGAGGGGGGGGPNGAGGNGGAGNNDGVTVGANTGAGAGGGGGPNPGTTRGGGGGEGSKLVSRIMAVTPLATLAVVIGAGGTAGAGETSSADGGVGGSGYCQISWVGP